MAGENGRIQLTLKPREEIRLLGGHRWVFSNELAEVPKDAEPGVLADLRSSKGKYMGVGFFNPKSLISFRLLSRTEAEIDKAFFKKRIEAAVAYRKSFLGDAESYRLCFGESDGLPGLVVDKFAGVAVMQVLAAGIERQAELIAEVIAETLGLEGVHLRGDHPTRALEGLGSESRTLVGKVPARVEITENGIRYAVSPLEGQKTGFYFDQRENRAFLAPFVKGKNVLDLFCFTGGFALTAAKHGALSVKGVDTSGPAIEAARENAKLNDAPPSVSFVEEKAEDVLEEAAGSKTVFGPDLIVLDPPSFVRNKKLLPQALRGYAKLNAKALGALRRGGLLATATCSHHVSRESFVSMLRDACSQAGRDAKLRALRGQAQDHPVLMSMPETEYLHFALLEVV